MCKFHTIWHNYEVLSIVGKPIFFGVNVLICFVLVT